MVVRRSAVKAKVVLPAAPLLFVAQESSETRQVGSCMRFSSIGVKPSEVGANADVGRDAEGEVTVMLSHGEESVTWCRGAR